jgi:hypothetical protein
MDESTSMNTDETSQATRTCTWCGRDLPERAFSQRQWTLTDPRCRRCLNPPISMAGAEAEAAERRRVLPHGGVIDGSVAEVIEGSDATATKALNRALEAVGPLGNVAHHLLAAQKNSSRAKKFRSYADRYYDTKGTQIVALTDALQCTELVWGWGADPNGFLPWVLYVDLPTGQVSFHSRARGVGPDYPGVWDGVQRASEPRIIAWAQSLLPTWTYDRPIADNWTIRARKMARRLEREVLIVGDTYPVREQLRALGGRWDPRKKGWWVPRECEQQARQLVESPPPAPPVS